MKTYKISVNNQKSINLLALAVIFLTFSCNTGSVKDNNTGNTGLNADSAITKENVEKDMEKKIYSLPSSFEITYLINKAGASYILDLTNSAENVKKYYLEKSKAINLGVYLADLSYVSTYNMKEEASVYLSASKQLADKLGIDFDKTLIDRIHKNIDNKDSVNNIISDKFTKINESLNKENKTVISSFILTGTWIEGFYISTQITSFARNNTKMKEIIAQEYESLEKLLKILSADNKNADIADLTAKLKEVQDIYNKYKVIVENKDSKESSIDDQFMKLTNKIESVRNKIIS